jgi:selT/selW/selH-like putative selenoprotein
VAAEIRDALGAEAELIEGSGGVFDVTVDGTLVYSKSKTGRFPDRGEIVGLIEGM